MVQPVINFTPDAPAVPSGPQAITFTPDPPQGNGSSGVGDALADIANNSFISSMNKAIAVPGKPEWNANAAENYIRSKLPSWLGGEPVQQSEEQQAANQKEHRYVSAAGSFTGHALEAAPALMIPGGEVVEGADAAPLAKALWLIGKNAASGALSSPDHPVTGAVVGGTLGGIGAGANALIAPNAAKAAEMAEAGLTPTSGTTNRLVGALTNANSGARNKMIQFGQRDLWNAAVSKFKNVPGADDILQELQANPSLDGVRALQSQLYTPADASLEGTVVPASPTLLGTISHTVRQYASNVAPTVQDPSVASFAQDIKNMAASGKLTGPNALSLYRSIRDRAFSATDRQTADALNEIAGSLRAHLTGVATDGGAALNQADKLYGSTKVLQDALIRSQGAQPSIQNMLAANKAAGAFSGSNGPYSALVTKANEVYKGAPETSGRFANLTAAAVSKALPFLAAHLAPGHELLGYLAGEGAEGMASPLVGALANRGVSAVTRPTTLAQALRLAGVNAGATGATNAVLSGTN